MSSPPSSSLQPIEKVRKFIHSQWFLPLSILGLTLCVYSGTLLGFRPGVISCPGTDTNLWFIYWRQFAADQLRHGHVPLWNPHLFSGTPSLGGWQAAVMYPGTWINLIVPVAIGLNIEFITHVFLAGWFGSLLAKKFGLHPVACVVTGTIIMFGGAYDGHLFAGHLSMVEALPWVSLVLLAVDDLLDAPNLRSALLGSFAAAMMVLAGHPQTVFNTVVIVALYSVIRLVKLKDRPKALAALVALGVGALLLSAVQLMTGLQIAGEYVRSKPSFAFSSTFSFPPESWATLFAPKVFGDMTNSPYWGRWYWWEANAFLSVTALPLIVIGFIGGANDRRKLWMTMMLVLAVLMMGGYTPVFHILFDHVPGFSRFRGQGKFAFEFTVFAALLAGAGVDALLARARTVTTERIEIGVAKRTQLGVWVAFSLSIVVALACLTGASLMTGDAGQGWMAAERDSHEIYTPPITTPSLVDAALKQSAHELDYGGLVAFGVSVALLFGRKRRRIGYVLAMVSILELANFAHSNAVTFNPSMTRPASVAEWLSDHPGDYRVLQLAYPPNSSMDFPTSDIWGYDPLQLQRYSELMAASQGEDLSLVSSGVSFTRPSPALALFRCAYVFMPQNGQVAVLPVANPMPHAALVTSYQVIPNRDAELQTILNPSFNPLKSVVLETDPAVIQSTVPLSANVTVTAVNSDSEDVDVTVPNPGIIVVTDPYSKFWHATAFADSVARSYTIQPANYAQIGIPVAAGHHHFRLTYGPSLFIVGAWMSGLSILAWAGLVLSSLKKTRSKELGGAVAATPVTE